MMRYNFLIRASWFIVLFLMLPAHAFACRCPKSISPQAAYSNADMVIGGKVTSIKGDVNDESGVAANFVVDKAWKTQVRKHVVVFSTTTCAYDLKQDAEYLLYVIALPRTNEFSTKRCMGNLLISDASDALDWLSRYGTEASVIDN